MGQHPLEARDERRSCFRDTALHMPCCANPPRPRCPRHPTLGCTTLEWSRLLMTLRPWHCYHNRRLRPSGQGQLKTSPGPETVFVLHQTSHHANWTNCVHGFFISSDILFRVDSSSRHLQVVVGKTVYGWHVRRPQLEHRASPGSLLCSLTNGILWDNIFNTNAATVTYDHRSVRTGHPVRSAIHKH